MKKYFTFCIILIAGICLYSCSDSTSSKDNYSESLIGEWRWVKTTGGIDGNYLLTPEKAGYNLNYIFIDTLLISKKNGVITDTSKYIYRKDLSYLSKDSVNMFWIEYRFPFDPGADYKLRSVVEFKVDTLILGEDCVDGQAHWYVRVR